MTGPTKYVLPKTKHTKLDGLSVGKFTKLCLLLCFVTTRPLRIFWKKITDLSFIQRQSSTQVKEDVLGLLGIEGGLFGLVGRWLFFFFVVSRCGVFLPGRIDRFNDDQCVCVCLETLVFLRAFRYFQNVSHFVWKHKLKMDFKDCFLGGHPSFHPVVSFVPPFFIRMLEFVLLSPANDECFEYTRTCRTSSFQFRVWSF